MANNRELTITLTAMTAPLTSGLASAQREIRNFATAAVSEIDKIADRGEKMKSVWKDMLEAFVGVEIVDSLVKIAEAANRATDALEIAARVSKNFGKDFDVADMDSWLHKLAASAEGGGYSITEMRDAVQQLATTGASEAQQQRLLVDILGLAAARHISVAEATHLAVMAAEGHLEALSRVGIATHDAAGNLLTYTQIMSNWESMVAGAAQARAEGLDGAFGRLSSSVNDLVRAFGAGLIPIMTGAANAAGAMASAIAALPPGVLDTIGAIVAFTLGLTALGLVIPAVVKAMGFFMNGLLLLFDLLGPLVAGIRNLVTWLSLMRDAFATAAVAEWLALAPITAIVVAVAALVAIVVEAVRGFKDLKAAWDWISGIVAPKIPKGPEAGASLAGLGGADKNAQKSIDDWLTAQKAAIEAAVQFATQRVAAAQASLEETTAKLEELRAKRDPSKPLGPGSAAEEQRLINEQIDRQRALQADVARQREAELKAASQLAALAKALPAGDKDRVKHAAELTQESSKATIEALKLLSTFEKMGGALAQLGRALRDAIVAPLRQAAEDAQRVANSAFDAAAIRQKASETQGQLAFQLAHIFRPATAVESAQFKASQASDRIGLGSVDGSQSTGLNASLDKARADYARIQQEINDHLLTYKDGQDQLAAAALKVTQAEQDLATGMAELRIATREVVEAQRERANRDRKEILDKTAGKIPGVTTTATGGLGAFNWGSVFADAIAQSHAFANVMQLVNEIMSVFTQIFESLEPIIDSLLTVIAMLVNGFISLWNMIARLVGILGIHLQQLQYINTVFNAGTANMVTFFHDIPTLNELASGNVGPLGPETSSNPLIQIHYDLTNMQNSQQGWFGSIIGDLALLGAVDWLTGGKFLSGLPIIGNLFQNVGNFLKTGIDSLGQLFVNGWNGLQNWMMTNLGQVGAGIFNIAAGAALLSTHDTGVAGFLEKILGVLEIIQGVAQLFGSGSIFSQGGLLSGLANQLLGGGGTAGSFGSWGASAGAGAGGLGTAGAAAAAAAADPAIAAAAAAAGVTPAAYLAAADAAAQTGLPIEAILAGSGGAPVDVAFAGSGAGLGGDVAGGAAAGGTTIGAGLAAAGTFLAPLIAAYLLNTANENTPASTISSAAAQLLVNWTGNGMVVQPQPGAKGYTGVQPGDSFTPQSASSLASVVLQVIQQPLSSFSSTLQPIVAQLQQYAQTALQQINQGVDPNDPGFATSLNSQGVLADFTNMGTNNPLIQQLAQQLIAGLGGGGTSGDLPPVINIAPVFTGDITSDRDIQDVAAQLGTLTLQQLQSNAYSLTGTPGRSTLLAQ